MDTRTNWLNSVITGVIFWSHLDKKTERTAACFWHIPTSIPHYRALPILLFCSRLGKRNWTKCHNTSHHFFPPRNCSPNHKETDWKGLPRFWKSRRYRHPQPSLLDAEPGVLLWKTTAVDTQKIILRTLSLSLDNLQLHLWINLDLSCKYEELLCSLQMSFLRA